MGTFIQTLFFPAGEIAFGMVGMKGVYIRVLILLVKTERKKRLRIDCVRLALYINKVDS